MWRGKALFRNVKSKLYHWYQALVAFPCERR